MAEEKLIWNRVMERARQELHDYSDALVISQAMFDLACSKLSGMELRNGWNNG